MKLIANLKSSEIITRAHWVVGVFFGLILIVVLRFVYLMILESDFLVAQLQSRSIRTKSIVFERGEILDRNGETLATSRRAFDIWVDPKQFENYYHLSKLTIDDPKKQKLDKDIQALASVLEVDVQFLLQRLTSDHRRFNYLRRNVTPVTKLKVELLGLQAIDSREARIREYPYREATAHVVGYTDIDHRGIEGLEKMYDALLGATHGQIKYRKDQRGNIVEVLEKDSGKDSENLHLTIDARLNFLAYQEMVQLSKKYNLSSMSAIAMDIKTGEVLAMTNTPSYSVGNVVIQNMRNRAITDMYEPGWMAAPFTMLTKMNLDDTRITETPAQILRNRDLAGLSDFLQIQAAPETFNSLLYDNFFKLGFGDSVLLLLGESPGLLDYSNDLAKTESVANGYGWGVTLSQITSAYRTLLNKGVKDTPRIIMESFSSNSRIFSERITESIMEGFRIPHNSEFSIAIPPNYTAGGIYSIVPKAVSGGYSEDEVVAMSVIFAPFDDPQIVLGVLANEPNMESHFISDPEIIVAEFSSVFLNKALPHIGVIPEHQNEGKR